MWTEGEAQSVMVMGLRGGEPEVPRVMDGCDARGTPGCASSCCRQLGLHKAGITKGRKKQISGLKGFTAPAQGQGANSLGPQGKRQG